MKAIRVTHFGGPEVLELQEIPTPQPASNEILVRVKAVGVNPVETYIRAGTYPSLPTLPYTPGKDAAGIVETIGDGVTKFKTGDRVYISNTISGAYAEYALCHFSNVHPLSENVSFAQGAALNTPYATAYRALFQKAHAVSGETVLIHGASGGVGTAATQFARAAGLIVLGTASTERGRNLVLQNGAHHVLDHRAPDYLQKISELTAGRGVDVIIEMLANVNLANDLTILAKGGRVVVVGNRGKIEINPRDAMSRDAAILGMVLFNANAEELSKIHTAIFDGLENGTLKPVVGQELPLTDAPRAHELVMQPGAYGKIVLIP